MTRLWKIVTAVVVVAVALTAGWFLTRPSSSAPATAATSPAVTPTPVFIVPSDDTVTEAVPDDVTWELDETIAVPVSASAGPRRTSPEGVRSGFAQTPGGALLAAANWSAGLARTVPAPDSYPPLVQQRMAPWPGQDTALELARSIARDPGERHAIFQIAGFRFLSYDTTHATLLIAKQVVHARQAYADYINLVWTDGDWYVIPAIDGHGELGAPVTMPLLPEWTPFAGVA